MRELSPHHPDPAAFVTQVQRQQRQGFQVAYLEQEGEVRAVAGFRISELLFSGRSFYIDDLITRETDRSRGFGGELFDWLVAYAREQNCDVFSLDAGLERADAHRFYLAKGMKNVAHHFLIKL